MSEALGGKFGNNFSVGAGWTFPESQRETVVAKLKEVAHVIVKVTNNEASNSNFLRTLTQRKKRRSRLRMERLRPSLLTSAKRRSLFLSPLTPLGSSRPLKPPLLLAKNIKFTYR